MTPLQKAQQLVSQEILPNNVVEQVEALERRASEEDKIYFPWIYEGLNQRLSEQAVPKRNDLSFS